MNADLVKYLPLTTAIANALAGLGDKATLTDEQAKGNDKLQTTLADSIRNYAAKTLEDGVKGEEANAFLRITLAASGAKPGTCLNYGRAVEGFHKLAQAGQKLEGETVPSVKDAQSAMRTEKQVKLDDLRAELAPYVKGSTVEQLEAIIVYAKTLEIKLPKRKDDARTAGKVQDVTQEVAESAAA